MKEKILNQFLKITLIAITITLIISVGVFYHFFKLQVYNDLQSYIDFAGGILPDVDADMFSSDVRITWINADGEVLFDSITDASMLENHSNRPEIKAALRDGEGKSIRNSNTLSKRIFYYAVRLEDGTVLRVSKEAGSIWIMFLPALPTILGLAVILYVLCYFLSKHLTERIVSPIEKLVADIGNPASEPEYRELVPFVGALKAQREDILRSAAMRQEFTANVSHELKTPLTAISGYAELIETGMVKGDDSARFAGEIRKNSTRLLALINDIINLSELDDGVKLKLERMDLYEAAGNCVRNLQVAADRHEVKLMLLGTSAYISADRSLMDEVLYNLCDNAIRYNNKGGNVIVDVSSTLGGKVMLTVKDTGIGIGKEHQERIFERFYRVDKSRSRESGGTGLGLAIVKHILSSHGAELELESEVGKGTCITVTFDAAASVNP